MKFFSALALLPILSALFAVVAAAPITTSPRSADAEASTDNVVLRPSNFQTFNSRAANDQEIQQFLESLFTVDGLKNLFGRAEVNKDIDDLLRRDEIEDKLVF
jgi:hypothetical protein